MVAIPPWLQTVFFHSIGEFADGLFTKATAEDKAGEFDRGWGDEHQLQELIAKIPDGERPYWMDFIRWNYVERQGFFTKQVAKSRQKKLRLFLTSWDKVTEKGTMTKTTEKKLDDKTTEKVQLIEKKFKPASKNALGFVLRCVEIIREKEAELIKACQAQVPSMVASGQLPSGYVLTKDVLRRCREGGYIELVKYFEAAQLPIMPSPYDDSIVKTVDEQIQNLFGKDIKAGEMIRQVVNLVGAPMRDEMERDNERLLKARTSPFWFIALPFAHLRNLI